MHTETDPIRGIVLCLISYFFISLIGIFQKSISHSIAIPVILFFQSAVCLLLNFKSIFKNDIQSLKPNQPLTYFIRIAAGAGCFASLFFLIRFIPVSKAMLFQYSASLWIPFIMFIWFKIRMPKKSWGGILTGFLGMILILKPDQSMLNMISIVGILCGVLQAFSMVAIRKLSTEPIHCVLFYNFLTTMLISSLFLIPYWTPITLMDGILLCGIGVATYLGQRFLAYSCHFAHPTTLAPICYTTILYSGLMGWLFWHEMPDTASIMGMGLVVLGCLLTVFNNGLKINRTTTAQAPVSIAEESASGV